MKMMQTMDNASVYTVNGSAGVSTRTPGTMPIMLSSDRYSVNSSSDVSVLNNADRYRLRKRLTRAKVGSCNVTDHPCQPEKMSMAR